MRNIKATLLAALFTIAACGDGRAPEPDVTKGELVEVAAGEFCARALTCHPGIEELEECSTRNYNNICRQVDCHAVPDQDKAEELLVLCLDEIEGLQCPNTGAPTPHCVELLGL